MSVEITVELTPESQAILRKFENVRVDASKAIQRAMTRALEVTTGRIQERRLSGIGPFPPSFYRLGEVTQQLIRSTRATPAQIINPGTISVIQGTIGSSVKYAAIHEFGFKGSIRVRTQTKSYTRNMNMPERAPFRTGIKENLPYIQGEIEKELSESLGGKP
jgi:hypothetical protein